MDDKLTRGMQVVALLEQMEQKKKERAEKRRLCDHEWKSKYDFVYDYDHQDCHKCGASRMV